MSFAHVRVSLLPALGEPGVASDLLQAIFHKFRQYLRLSGVNVSTCMFYEEGAAGGYSGEFIVPLPHAVRPPLALAIAAWLQQQTGRAVQIRVGEYEIIARSAQEAESFLHHMQQLLEAPVRQYSK